MATPNAGVPPSWPNFISLWRSAQRSEAALIRLIVLQPELLPLLLKIVEEAFVVLVAGERAASEAPGPHATEPEELASAASFLVAKAAAEGVTPLRKRLRDDPDSRELAHSLLDEAHCLRSVREGEAAVYYLGYTVVRNGRGTYRIAPQDQAIGRALTIGYARTALQAGARRRVYEQSRVPGSDLRAFCADMEIALERIPELYRVTDHPTPRLQLHMPEPLAATLGQTVLLKDDLFSDEAELLRDTAYELQTTPKELMETQLAPHLNGRQLLQASRVLRFYGLLRSQKLQAIRADEPEVYSASLLGGGIHDEFLQIFALHGFAESTARAFLELVTWDARSATRLDLQYSPIIRDGDLVLIMYATHSAGNLFRNAFMRAKRRLYDDGSVEPVTAHLAAGLHERSPFVRAGFDYDFADIRGEVDVLAMLGDRLFVFECKHTLLPCDTFELRTLFDHLKKAASQLARFRRAFARPGFLSYLAKRLGWADLESVKEMHGVIVPSVRLLSGANFDSFPVRHVRELANLITTGKGHIGLAEQELVLNYWAGFNFAVEDLLSYLDSDGNVYGPLWAAAFENEVRADFGNWSLSWPVYGFDGVAHVEQLRSRGRFEDSVAAQRFLETLSDAAADRA